MQTVYFSVKPMTSGARRFMRRVLGTDEYQARALVHGREPMKAILGSFERRAHVRGTSIYVDFEAEQEALVALFERERFVGHCKIIQRPRPLR